MTDTALLRAVDGGDNEPEPLRRVHASAAYQYRVAAEPVGGAVKRVFDIIVAGASLICLSPLLLAICVLISLDSPGPVMFRQRRTGFRGRTFTILKFRTMTTMEQGGDVRQVRPGDARVTRIGRLLRRTSLDELPQLINVVLGHMSLVGPRPHAVRHDRVFFGVDEQYPRRFLARPGITGAAQVNGARGATETTGHMELRLLWDLDYVERWSFMRDLRILVATVRLLAGDRHAC